MNKKPQIERAAEEAARIKAVDASIRASKPKIGKREAKLIHAILKGRTNE